MKVLIATDAWHPQINGVVRTFERVCEYAPQFGADIHVVSPQMWKSVPLPTYSEIDLALCSYGSVAEKIDAYDPDYIHIATEGPVGWRARQYCQRRNVPFTSSYHTKVPEYLRARMPVPISWTYSMLRRFHNAGRSLMVTNESLRSELSHWGFDNIQLWSRAVDCKLFRPMDVDIFNLRRPIFTYVGRVSVEKNLDAFLSLDLPGTKVIVGKGPQQATLEKRYPDVHFTGALEGEDLSKAYASSDVFVFPSLTDTFGIVLLEAVACGVPVAAFPVTGPRDVLGGSGCGVLDDDLQKAALAALEIPRDRCRAFAETKSWTRSIGEFLNNILLSHGKPLYDLDAYHAKAVKAGIN
ncbi:MAG: glycosyltransferase family 1 protein [Pseudomonadota bacterium]